MDRHFKQKIFDMSSPGLQNFFDTEKGKEELRNLFYYHETSFPWSYIEKKVNKLEYELINLKP